MRYLEEKACEAVEQYEGVKCSSNLCGAERVGEFDSDKGGEEDTGFDSRCLRRIPRTHRMQRVTRTALGRAHTSARLNSLRFVFH